MVDRISFRLDTWKRHLIDLTRRNRLLNYRPTSVSTVEVVDEYPQLVFSQLLGGDLFTFDPVPEEDREDEADEASTPLPPDLGFSAVDNSRSQEHLRTGRDLTEARGEEVAERHRDTQLQTRLAPDPLAKNLTAIYRRAEGSLEEQGINTLFLALGMLEWVDHLGSGTRSKAPLLMVPVALTRKTAADSFILGLGDEDPFLNLALVEKLKIDFNVELPELPELAEDLDVEGIFSGVRKAVDGLDGWRLTSDIALGLFSFQKFIMYRDIELNEQRLHAHPLIRALCQENDGTPIANGLPTDVAEADLDAAMSPWVTVQVMDADSSQQRAMLAVREGHDLVIEGPPGTGKSQTIANIIADSLHQGKTVLFVSEKMAALQVVKDRLDHRAKLGSYVLELHSNKASKTDFVEELSRSLDAELSATQKDPSELKRLRRLTKELRTYVQEVHRPEEGLGCSPFEGIARLAELNEAPQVRFTHPKILSIDDDALRESKELVADLGLSLEHVGDPAVHPLRGLGIPSASRSDAESLERSVEKAWERFECLIECMADLSEELGLKKPRTLGEAGVDPVRWTLHPQGRGERSPRWERVEVHTPRISGDRWWSWYALAVRRRSCRGSLSRPPSRSGAGWPRRTGTRAAEVTA